MAWELAGDRRFRASYGTLDEVAAEIAAFQGDAILSSEDFEGVLSSAPRLSPLVDHKLLKGHEFTLVFWVRDQASYMESLFFQMLAYRMGEEVDRICDFAITCGQLRHEDWTFQFEYEAAAARLLSPAIKLVVRPYSRLTGGSSVNDFLAFANFGVPAMEGYDQPVNVRPDLAAALPAFYENRTGSKLEWHGALRAGITQSLGGQNAYLSPGIRSALAARFSVGNDNLAAIYSFPPEALAISLVPESAIPLEALFSLRTQRLLFDLANSYADADRVSATVRAAAGFVD